MTSNKNSKYANSNLNAVLSKSNAAPSAGGIGAGKLGFNGMLVLSKRPRTATGGKLSVPLPVNLPSIRKARQSPALPQHH
ncbi:hypothetical protein V8C86DRAFT_1782451 [Haematococcus lacustris]